ncbi:MAG TPA: alpha/beta hydrolase [Candidatus Limnocylindrales bacterium]|nr:alpha/beta hydrolase [Candidatus Limnocylindrales bacterium]
MQIVVQDLLVHYKEVGNGKTVILLHGWADRLETFQLLMQDLAQQYKVVALDLPGFGKTQPPKGEWNLDDYSQFLSHFLNKTGNASGIHAVVGHSNGGALAIRAVSLGLIRPDKLVLLAASGVRNTAKFKRAVLKLVAKTGKVATVWLPKSTRKKLQKKLYGTMGSDMLISPELIETFKQTVRQDVQADAASLSVPTLLVYGTDDSATPLPDVGQKLHALIKGSQLEVIPEADHFVHQAAPEQVNKLILGFLNK